MVAALIREMHIGRLEYLCPDWEFGVDAVRERLKCQSERPMICGEETFSLGRMQRLELLTVWKDKEKFEGWFLGKLPSGCYSLSLWDFKSPESSGWGMDTTYLGRANLLEAVENFDAFLGILKGDAFKRCMDPIRELWTEPGALVHQYHAVFLQYHLENMLRDYYQDITLSLGKVARLPQIGDDAGLNCPPTRSHLPHLANVLPEVCPPQTSTFPANQYKATLNHPSRHHQRSLPR